MAKIYQKHVAIVLKRLIHHVTGHETPDGEYAYSFTLSFNLGASHIFSNVNIMWL